MRIVAGWAEDEITEWEWQSLRMKLKGALFVEVEESDTGAAAL